MPRIDPADGSRALPFTRELLGRLVFESMGRAAAEVGEQCNPTPWDGRPKSDQEFYCLIGEDIARWTLIGDALRGAMSVEQSERE